MFPCKHTHTCTQYVHRKLSIKEVSQSDKNVIEGERGEGGRAVRECKELRLGLSSCDIWLDFDALQSGLRIFPRAARPSDGARDTESE